MLGGCLAFLPSTVVCEKWSDSKRLCFFRLVGKGAHEFQNYPTKVWLLRLLKHPLFFCLTWLVFWKAHSCALFRCVWHGKETELASEQGGSASPDVGWACWIPFVPMLHGLGGERHGVATVRSSSGMRWFLGRIFLLWEVIEPENPPKSNRYALEIEHIKLAMLKRKCWYSSTTCHICIYIYIYSARIYMYSTSSNLHLLDLLCSVLFDLYLEKILPVDQCWHLMCQALFFLGRLFLWVISSKRKQKIKTELGHPKVTNFISTSLFLQFAFFCLLFLVNATRFEF